MSERRFYLREQTNEAEIDYPEYTITESELKRRLVKIATYMHSEEGMWPRGIKTLLHEDKEQPERTDSLRRAWRDCCDCAHEKEIGTLSCHECFDDPARPIWESKEQPDEWEEWCDKIETAIVTRNKIKETFREMPRGS